MIILHCQWLTQGWLSLKKMYIIQVTKEALLNDDLFTSPNSYFKVEEDLATLPVQCKQTKIHDSKKTQQTELINTDLCPQS